MTIITSNDLGHQVSSVRNIFKVRSISIPTNSLLEESLTEVMKFVSAKKDLNILSTASATDSWVVVIGQQILAFWHLADSIIALNNDKVPHLHEMLIKLTSFKVRNIEDSKQWNEAKYELICANEFFKGGLRPSFIRTRIRPERSRYVKRVEFLLRNRWPVECKRPRKYTTIIDNIQKARWKIDERDQLGIIAISLENALGTNELFREFESDSHLETVINSEISTFISKNKESILSKGISDRNVAILFHYILGAYIYDSQCIAFPSVRCAINKNGEIIWNDVMVSLTNMLENGSIK